MASVACALLQARHVLEQVGGRLLLDGLEPKIAQDAEAVPVGDTRQRRVRVAKVQAKLSQFAVILGHTQVARDLGHRLALDLVGGD